MRASSLRSTARAAEKSLGELLQAVVAIFTRLGQQALRPGGRARIAPVVAGGRFGAGGVALVRAPEERPSRRQVVAGVGPIREGVPGGLLPPGVFVDECA